jgi:hypothetical protein
MLQILFRKKLSSKQWLSLILLTAGCMIKQIDFTKTDTANMLATLATPKSHSGLHLSINLVFIFIQVCCKIPYLKQAFTWVVWSSPASHHSTNTPCASDVITDNSVFGYMTWAKRLALNSLISFLCRMLCTLHDINWHLQFKLLFSFVLLHGCWFFKSILFWTCVCVALVFAVV